MFLGLSIRFPLMVNLGVASIGEPRGYLKREKVGGPQEAKTH